MKPVDNSGPNGVSRAITSPVRAGAPVRPVRLEDGEPRGAEALAAQNAGDAPPLDADRIAQIRKAIEDGTYPVTPVKIADAMIAAGFLLRIK